MVKRKRNRGKNHYHPAASNVLKVPEALEDPSALERLPVTYQAVNDYYEKLGAATPFLLRRETLLRIERVTKRPLVAYVTKTRNLPPAIPAYIDDSDLTGFSDLIQAIQGDALDVFIMSNGGSAEATERIVRLLRERFKAIRFIVPANAYSAATLLCFSGDEIIMDSLGTLGPIDPQINGIPARAILRAFETIEKRIKEEGPQVLAAYMPLIMKYDLHILEICKSAEELSKELAENWLNTYMLKYPVDDPRTKEIVKFFADYDIHKSHGRSIDRKTARGKQLKIVDVEEISGLDELVRSLCNQYELWLDKTSFFKLFENAYGINWGRQAKTVTLQVPVPQPVPQPGPPQRSQ